MIDIVIPIRYSSNPHTCTTFRLLRQTSRENETVTHHRVREHHVVAIISSIAIDIPISVIPHDRYTPCRVCFPVFDELNNAFAVITLIVPLPVRSADHSIAWSERRVVN